MHVPRLTVSKEPNGTLPEKSWAVYLPDTCFAGVCELCIVSHDMVSNDDVSRETKSLPPVVQSGPSDIPPNQVAHPLAQDGVLHPRQLFHVKHSLQSGRAYIP